MSASPFSTDLGDTRWARAGEWGWLALTALFLGANILSLNLFRHGTAAGGAWLNLVVWLVLMVGATVALQRFRPVHDPLILPAIGLLLGWGFLEETLPPSRKPAFGPVHVFFATDPMSLESSDRCRNPAHRC